MTPRRAAATAVAAVVGGVGVLLLVALWAASIGPDRVLHGPGLQRVTPTASPSSDSASPSPSASQQQRAPPPPVHQAGNHPFLRAFAIAVELVLLLVVLRLLVHLALWARQRWRDRVRAPAKPEHIDFDVLEQLDEARDQVAADTDDAMRLLADGQPRNGIVAAWDRFEATAATLYLQRRPWETSSEFVIRMLDVVAADGDAVVDLERLYREARFSTHDLSEEHRAAAADALQRIQLSLGRLRSRR